LTDNISFNLQFGVAGAVFFSVTLNFSSKEQENINCTTSLCLLETIYAYAWFFANYRNKFDAQTTISVLENAFATVPNSFRDYLSRNQIFIPASSLLIYYRKKWKKVYMRQVCDIL